MRVQLTSGMLARFKGGQMEIQKKYEKSIYCGQISTISVEEDEILFVTFTWFARGLGFPPTPTRWVKDGQSIYTGSLAIFFPTTHGPKIGNVGGNEQFMNEVRGKGRVSMDSEVLGHKVVLYPPSEVRLDPARVEGLQLS